jgi:hypothetical protein
MRKIRANSRNWNPASVVNAIRVVLLPVIYFCMSTDMLVEIVYLSLLKIVNVSAVYDLIAQ